MGTRASLVVQLVNNLPAIQETPVQFLGQEDPPEKEMATHSSILAWRIPRTGEPGRLQPMGSQRVGHNFATNTFTFKWQQNRSWFAECGKVEVTWQKDLCRCD